MKKYVSGFDVDIATGNLEAVVGLVNALMLATDGNITRECISKGLYGIEIAIEGVIRDFKLIYAPEEVNCRD